MSYLSSLRLHFSGQFQTDPSTVNNDPQHFDTEHFRSNYQLRSNGSEMNGWWNPRGSGAWRFANCTVQRVVYGDGTHCDDPNSDPVVGAVVGDTESRTPGRLVDLDSQQQMVSQIWGFQITIKPALAGIPGIPQIGFRGDFKPAAFADIWPRFPTGQPDSFFGALYQSVLTSVEWFGNQNSRFLTELAANGQPPTQLSIKFNVDGYNDDPTSATFTLGRVTGTIALCEPDEPAHFLAGRALASVPASPPTATLGATAYAQIVGDTLLLDLGNSLPTQSVGGPFVNNGLLCAALMPTAPNSPPVILGEIPYRAPNFYAQTAGVVAIKLNAAQLAQAATTPLAVLQSVAQPGGAPFATLMLEASNGVFVRADDFVFRLNPGDSVTTKFYATTFGQRTASLQISLGYDASQMGGASGGPIPPPATVGQPTSAFTFTPSFTTGADGTAVATLTAGDPGNPRGYIDGQVYGVIYGPGTSAPPPGSSPLGNLMLNALVWSGYTAPARPSWIHDVQPIFQQYANLYPVMLPLFNMADYASVVSRRQAMQAVFSTAMDEPNYMPVTRDLSKAKRAMIRRWLSDPQPLYMRLDSVDDLEAVLQQALELEHATIPPYLCALYSIKPGCNVEVAEAIRSVAVEEMLHMALVANLMISLGMKPSIGHPTFVPRYPGPLPGGVRGKLTVRLRRCSIEQIRDVFLAIEEPEETAAPEKGEIDPKSPDTKHPFTIGWFYKQIAAALTRLSTQQIAGRITFGHADLQVPSDQWRGPGELVVIKELKDAIAAIDQITDQGEGASPLDPDDGDDELAHYFRFAEIVEGRRLVKLPSAPGKPGGFAYIGDKVPFDPNGVWPMMDDPDLVKYPAGSRAAILATQFARTYQALLNSLNLTFNGQPAQLRQAISQMFALNLAAQELMQTPSGLGDGTTAGPSFQLPEPL